MLVSVLLILLMYGRFTAGAWKAYCLGNVRDPTAGGKPTLPGSLPGFHSREQEHAMHLLMAVTGNLMLLDPRHSNSIVHVMLAQEAYA